MILPTPSNLTLYWHVSLQVSIDSFHLHISLITNTLHINISSIGLTNLFYWQISNRTLHWYVSLTCFAWSLQAGTFQSDTSLICSIDMFYMKSLHQDTFHKHLSLRHIPENFQFKLSLDAYGQHNNIKELKDSFIRYCFFNEEIFLSEISNLRHHFTLHMWIMVCNVIGLECT